MLNQSEKLYYSPNLFWINQIQKIFLRVKFVERQYLCNMDKYYFCFWESRIERSYLNSTENDGWTWRLPLSTQQSSGMPIATLSPSPSIMWQFRLRYPARRQWKTFWIFIPNQSENDKLCPIDHESWFHLVPNQSEKGVITFQIWLNFNFFFP